MAKVEITSELSQLIKTTRITNNVKSIDLADHISKSVAYISKLENNGIKQIDFSILIQIFKFLLPQDENFNDFINSVLDKCQIELTDKELENQKWATKFDIEIREVPIPKDIVEFIKNKIEELSITTKQVIDYINKNEELLESDIDFSKYEKNTYIPDKDSIIFDLKESLLDDIISHKTKTVNYLTMLVIIKTLFNFEGFSHDDARKKARALLKSFKFYTLSERKEVIRQNKHSDAIENMLNEYDRENIKHVNKIINHIKVLSDWNINYTNPKLENLANSFENDPPFILAIIGQEYNKLSKLKTEDKKVFLQKLKQLINEFSEINYDDKETFELY